MKTQILLTGSKPGTFPVIGKTRTFILNRAGTFELTQSHIFQCKAVGHKAYTYNIKMEFSDQLDERGFLIDHNVVHDHIVSKIVLTVNSCENLCLNISSIVGMLCLEKNIRILKSLVTVNPVIKRSLFKRRNKYNRAFMELETIY